MLQIFQYRKEIHGQNSITTGTLIIIFFLGGEYMNSYDRTYPEFCSHNQYKHNNDPRKTYKK